jgi:hypothetical protein
MRCEEVNDLFPDLLAGSLDAAAAADLREHLASCATCQVEYAEVDTLWQALGRVPTPAVHSNRMRERFSAMVAAERASSDRRTASRPAGARAWAPRWMGEPLVQLAMAASLLIVGVLVGRALPPRVSAPPAQGTDIAEVRSELRDMRQMLTLSLMQQQSATERLRGVSWSAQIDRPGTELVSALLDTLLHDPNVNVRLAVVDALRRFSDRQDVRLGTEQALADRTSPLIQVALIDFMVETRNPEAPALFRTLLQDASVDASVRGRAQWGLEQFAS